MSATSLDWIKRRKLAEERKAQQQELDRVHDLSASLLLKHDGPVFWEDILKELRAQIIELPSIGIEGSVNINNTELEQFYTLNLRVGDSPWPASTSTILFYRPGGPAIRIHGENGETGKLQFQIVGEHLKVVANNGTTDMDAEDAAAFIVRSLVDRIKPE
jgi:hypothetical protein